MSRPIEDYALIGDCETAALVGRDGSIDWLCWPRFDSPACFAALLGTRDHGRWLIAPVDSTARVSRRYRGHTLILETTFATRDGTATVIDFMPPRGNNSDVVRIVRGDDGHVRMRTELLLRFDYGRTIPWVTKRADGGYCAIAGPDRVVLHTTAPLHGEAMTTVGEFEVTAGASVSFVLTHGPSHLPAPEAAEPESALVSTESFWNDWMEHGVEGDWAEVLGRSLVTLKALTYAPTGGLVAAPTTSLPEHIGGARNWDYRYCWVRDATLTLLALMNAGYYGEARAWRDWLLRAAAGAPAQLQIMYGVGGERRLPETSLPWLPGYEQSAPVRIGNDAAHQLQLDVYGELMDALYQARRGGLTPRESDWAFQTALLEHLESVWQEADAGIWEMRGPPRHFTFSKVMAWVAFDRGVRTAEQFSLVAPLDRWRRTRRTIHDTVCRDGFSQQRGRFTQAFGSEELDASLLLLPTVGFLPVSDQRIRDTIAAIEQDLLVDGVVLRYNTHSGADGLPPGEGAFLACTLWLADAYVLQGRHDDALRLFNHVVSLANDVGLLSEEYDSRAKRLVGNFPQAFSHVALINTVHNLARATKPAEQRAS
ncbi:MAG TPA: glycoside hydrolase family 15 protein [Vicinamibacterales bacterium]